MNASQPCSTTAGPFRQLSYWSLLEQRNGGEICEIEVEQWNSSAVSPIRKRQTFPKFKDKEAEGKEFGSGRRYEIALSMIQSHILTSQFVCSLLSLLTFLETSGALPS